jgi:phenylacetate-CoA ligase
MTAGDELTQHIKSRIGVTTEVAVVEPGKIERSLGKAKRVVDLRPKD